MLPVVAYTGREDIEMGGEQLGAAAGPHWVGENVHLDRVLARLSSEYRLDTDVCVVRLNGLIHASGPAAVEQIIMDLKIEEAKSFESSLSLLLEHLYESKRKMTPIVFILDNFDLLTKHKNQNLLYSLFDITQSNSCPISVVGITCEIRRDRAPGEAG